ncbi:MAG: hypothetical protein JST20_12860 [Bacteroidetes bacterium]|nr:hypothetical protein [Bacteroidota bacterium]
MNAHITLRFPTGYQVNDIYNDNIDVHFITEFGEAYFAVVYTLENIAYLMKKDNTTCFWGEDMVIVSDLREETILSAAIEIYSSGFIKSICTYAGNINNSNEE